MCSYFVNCHSTYTYLTHSTKSPRIVELSRTRNSPVSHSDISTLLASSRLSGPKNQLKDKKHCYSEHAQCDYGIRIDG